MVVNFSLIVLVLTYIFSNSDKLPMLKDLSPNMRFDRLKLLVSEQILHEIKTLRGHIHLSEVFAIC